ncbi:pentapeptide repeat-containing protein [Rhizobium rhizophilum]|uniref:Pentapeptide repeat-containing protein n=1 Tax=Rhizobium rhizophilum TaxID=1850373 RepID=A0ABY2QTI0_9HYPH|nr:pentapeptide repeat-containing protein [Rhizobium rhizophilum]THV13769.1 pentapeptide repeat-containing protein [Rhizobium rhizophilum]
MIPILPKMNWLSKFREFVFVVDIVAIPIGVVAIIQSSAAINLQVQSNEDQRVAAAWSQVANRATGNSGKGEALNLLFERGEKLSGLLIDCESMGGRYVDDPVRRCKGAPYIDGLRLVASDTQISVDDIHSRLNSISLNPDLCDTGRLDIIDADFSGATLASSVIYCAMMIDVTMKDTWFSETIIANSWLYNADISGAKDFILAGNRYDGLVAEGAVFTETDFKETQAAGINFSNAKFDKVNFRGMEGGDYNVSGAHFCFSSNTAYPPSEEHCVVDLPESVLKEMWAWSDMPPIGIGAINEKLAMIKRCPAELRTATFGKEYADYGFVYDRGYKAPDACAADNQSDG